MSPKLHNAVIKLLEFIAKNSGPTDDFPMDISFDNDITAEEFARLLNKLQELTEFEYTPHL
jgi:hypothetical protein